MACGSKATGTAANLKHAARVRDDILQDIRNGSFSMATYFPEYKFTEQLQEDLPSTDRTFSEWCAVWAKLKARSTETSTLAIYKRHLLRWLCQPVRIPFG